MRTQAQERTVQAAFLLGEIMDRISEGLAPSCKEVLPADFDPRNFPALRFLSGVSIDIPPEGQGWVFLHYDLPEGVTKSARLSLPGPSSRDRRALIDAAHAFVQRVLDHESLPEADSDIRTHVMHIAGNRLVFSSVSIEMAERTLADDKGHVPDLSEVTRFLDRFLADRTGDEIEAAIGQSPRAFCYAAVAAGRGISAWPCASGHSPFMH